MTESITLPVDNGHVLQIERSGNPSGTPVFLLHGGPGAGANRDNKNLFDPTFYDIYIYDQRGCGDSKPKANISNNTTQHLVDDIRLMLSHFRIDKAMLVGGSWGATLALLFAKTFPNNVSALVLRGAFLARQEDLDWFLSDSGVATLLPVEYAEFNDSIRNLGDITGTDSMINLIFAALTSDDRQKKLSATEAWAKWSWAVLNYSFEKKIPLSIASLDQIYPNVLIELHYAKNKYFLTEDILNNFEIIESIPTTLIHGSRDVMCLPHSSWYLSKHFKNNELKIIHGAGHLSSDKEIKRTMIEAIESMKKKI